MSRIVEGPGKYKRTFLFLYRLRGWHWWYEVDGDRVELMKEGFRKWRWLVRSTLPNGDVDFTGGSARSIHSALKGTHQARLEYFAKRNLHA